MKTTLTFIVLLFAQSVALMGQQPDAKAILQQSAQVLKDHQLFQYEASHRMKYFDTADTTPVRTYSCTLLKVPEDTVLGYYARVYNSGEDKIYDGTNFLLIWHEPKKILRDQPRLTGKRFAQNNIQRDFIPNFLYSKTPFQAYLTEAVDWNIEEDLFAGHKVWKIAVFLPVNEEITFIKRVVFIDQKSYLPLKVEGFAKFQNIQDEYFELTLKNVSATKYNGVDFAGFYQYPADYAEEVFQTPKVNYDLLPKGAPVHPFEAPDFAGAVHRFTPAEEGDQLVLFDFWYLACAPCIKALPHLVELHEKYKSRGLLVYGINPIDQPEKRKGDIEKFANKYNIAYPLLFTEKDIAEKYLVKSYPTIYLIKDGVVLHASFSMGEEKWRELEQLIEANLSK